MSKATLAAAGILLAAGTAAQHAEAAENYPIRPIRFIVPYAPGGPTDILARLLGQKLTERWKQQVLVDNRAGANGTIGGELAAKSPPDGYTLFLGNTSGLTINPILYKKLAYDPVNDFAPVNLTVAAPLLLVVHPSVGVRRVGDLIKLAKARPGELAFASSGAGGVAHLSGELLMHLTGVRMIHVPYKGAGLAAMNTVTGEVSLTFTSAVSVMPHVKAGRLRAVAVTTPKRSKLLPEIPAVAETVAGFDVSPWYGVFVPAGVGRGIIDKLHAEIGRIVALPEVAKRLTSSGGEIVSASPDEFSKILKAEREKWAAVVKSAGIKLN